MKSLKDMPLDNAQARQDFLLSTLPELIKGTITRGQLIRHLRKEMFKFNQQEFANYCNVSRRTLTDIENDADKLNEESLNKVLNIFGLKVGVVPISEKHAQKLVHEIK